MSFLIHVLIAQVSFGVEPIPQPALTATAAVETAPAEPSVTLSQLLESAEARNLDRRVSLEQQRKSDEEVRQAWSALLPGLSVQAGWTHNQYASEIPAGRLGPEAITLVPQEQLDFSARVDVPIVDVQKWMRTAAVEASRGGVMARGELTLDQVRRAVMTTWYGYAGALALEASSERSVSTAEAQLKLQEIRERAGTATELELLRARAEVQRSKLAVADASKLIAILRRSLLTLTGTDPGPAAVLPTDDLAPALPLEALEARVEQLPAVRAAEQDRVGAEKVATAAKLALVPTVAGQFTERVSNGAGFTGQASSFTLGVNLQWRLDAPTVLGMDVQASNLAIAGLSVEKARRAARDQINADWQSLQAALIKVEAVGAQVEAARRAREVASKRYQVGASTQLDLIQADRDLFGAEVQQIQARSDLASARASLQLSAGLPIEPR